MEGKCVKCKVMNVRKEEVCYYCRRKSEKYECSKCHEKCVTQKSINKGRNICSNCFLSRPKTILKCGKCDKTLKGNYRELRFCKTCMPISFCDCGSWLQNGRMMINRRCDDCVTK